MNSQIYKNSEIMEDMKQDITEDQYKIIMDSWMELRNGKIETKIKICMYTQKEVDELTNNRVKLSLDTFFQYIDDENDMLWFETRKGFAEDKLMIYNIEHFLKIEGKTTKIWRIYKQKKLENF